MLNTATGLGRGWSERGWVLIGRGASGALPVLLLALAARAVGLQAMGGFASALAIAAALAEVADVSSQRHIPRLAPTEAGMARTVAFLALRRRVLAIGLVPAFFAAALAAEPGGRMACLVVVIAAIPMAGTNSVYAVALAGRKYLVLGLGPLVGLVAALGVTIGTLSFPGMGVWGPTLGLLAGKTTEWAVVARTAVPAGVHTTPEGSIGDEWRSTRFLLYQALLSAAHARLVIPFIAVLNGAPAAGLLSVGISLLSVVSLVGLAVTVPAYRAALENGAPRTPREAFTRVTRDWWLAVGMGAMLTAALCASVPWLLPVVFHLHGDVEVLAVVLVVAAALFEPLALFAGGLYHASFQDRRLFHLGVANVAVGWLLTAVGGWMDGPVGMGVGFLASRAVAVAILYGPIIRGDAEPSREARAPLDLAIGTNLRPILVGVPDGPMSPAPRVRVLQYLPWFEAAGARCSLEVMRQDRSTARSLTAETAGILPRTAHLIRTWLAAQRFQWRLARRAPEHVQVLLHRIPISTWGRILLSRYRQRIVFDFDDALYDAEPEQLGLISAVRRRVLRRSLENAIAISRVVVTSNEQNAAFVRSVGGRAVVIPTSVDTDRIQGVQSTRIVGEHLVLGWMGTPSTARYLAAVEEPLARVSERHDVVIRLVGVRTNPFRRLPAEVRPWLLDDEAKELAEFDIGIMPMPDTAWSRGKAAYKALQYGAATLPTVASWTPTNEIILGRGGGTILCRTVDDWATALERLICDEALRHDLGRLARANVVAGFSLRVNAPRLVATLFDTAVLGDEESRP